MDVAGFHEGAEELGTSDISIMLRQIMRKLEEYNQDDWYDEKGGVNPKGAYDAGGHFHLDRAR